MWRQRLRIEGSIAASAVGRVLVVVLSLALIYYGAMVVLLALKLSPATVNELSGYRTAFNYLSGLTAGDISSSDRLIAAIVGGVVAILAAILVWRGLPRAHLARKPIVLAEGEKGMTEIQPRAMERALEIAALEDSRVTAARARYGDGAAAVTVTTGDAVRLVEVLQDVERLARLSLSQHGLAFDHVDVTLAGFNRSTRRELT